MAFEEFDQALVPTAAIDIEQQRPAGVRVVGGVALAACELPDEPAIDGPGADVPGRRAGTQLRVVAHKPGELRPGKIGVQLQSSEPPKLLFVPFCPELRTDAGRPPILPDQGVGERLTGFAVPHDEGLALVGDSDGGQVRSAEPGLREGDAHGLERALPDLFGVVLHPAGLGVVLAELLLAQANNAAIRIDEKGTRTCGPLVDCEDVRLRHPREYTKRERAWNTVFSGAQGFELLEAILELRVFVAQLLEFVAKLADLVVGARALAQGHGIFAGHAHAAAIEFAGRHPVQRGDLRVVLQRLERVRRRDSHTEIGVFQVPGNLLTEDLLPVGEELAETRERADCRRAPLGGLS
ncbi:MAG TPA: hypothetical protein PKD27_09705, partial [Tepidiformaceae bacterium]|nr:hypothetical protein [Tepidiformaceae bacterium]